MHADARALDVMIAAVLVFTAAIGAVVQFQRAHFGRVPAWVLETAMAACVAAYVIIAALPMARHLPFLSGAFPLSMVLSVAVIVAGFMVLLLRFVL